MELRNSGRDMQPMRFIPSLLKAFFCKRPCPNAAALLREFDNLIHSFPELAGPAVVTHLNSGFPKPLAPTGAASQSYQLPPVADLLRLSSILIFLLSFLAQGCLCVRREARMIFHGKFLAFDSHLSSLFRPENSSIRAF